MKVPTYLTFNKVINDYCFYNKKNVYTCLSIMCCIFFPRLMILNEKANSENNKFSSKMQLRNIRKNGNKKKFFFVLVCWSFPFQINWILRKWKRELKKIGFSVRLVGLYRSLKKIWVRNSKMKFCLKRLCVNIST